MQPQGPQVRRERRCSSPPVPLLKPMAEIPGAKLGDYSALLGAGAMAGAILPAVVPWPWRTGLSWFARREDASWFSALL